MKEKKAKKPSPRLPLTHALGWIVGSMLFFNGIAYSSFKFYLRSRHRAQSASDRLIRTIVQTGPQKEALKTEYLAEILGISADFPPHPANFNLSSAKQKLLSSPLISQATITLMKPSTLYIDYTVRQPLAWLSDFENLVIDKEGFAFPLTPFFSPKNLPGIYIGLAPFGMASEDPEKPTVQWRKALKGKYLDLALDILAYVTDPKVSEHFNVTWIDVSHAFSQSCGTREIVLISEDVIFLEKEETRYIFPRVLRLSAKSYAQELGNYIKLREQLLEDDQKKISAGAAPHRAPDKIIDFRIPNLAFIE